jgi:hypothetical protein
MRSFSTYSLAAGLLALLATGTARAQTGVGIGTLCPDASAALDISSTSKGVLLPRVSLSGPTDATTITNPSPGLTVYNTLAVSNLPVGLASNLGTTTAPNWQPAGAGQYWSLTGNAGTAAGTNFLGTTDSQPLLFRTNNVEVGRFAVGGAFWVGQSGSVLVGYQAGLSSTGAKNTFLGYQSGYSNTSGASNLMIGTSAGKSNQGGSNNIVVGVEAGLQSNGQDNLLIGNQSGLSTIGYANVYLGNRTGYYGTSNTENVLIGWSAGYGNQANGNVYVGTQAGMGGGPAQTGGNNVIMGYQAGYNIAAGAGNVFIGNQAGNGNTLSYTGQPTQYPGAVTSGSNNTFIGNQSGLFSTTQHSNATAIGYQAKAGADNTLVLGGTGSYAVHVGIGMVNPSEVLQVAGNILASGTITQNSDRRLKTNVRPLTDALASVDKLRGVRYEFLPGKGPTGEQVGVIAQEVEAVYPELVGTDPNTGIKSVNYAQLTPVLLEAIKELQTQVSTQAAAQLTTQASLEELRSQLISLQVGSAATTAAAAGK